MMDPCLLSPCNYYCGNCAIYKRGLCSGCAEATEKAKSKGKVFCGISVCARERKLTSCSDCESYPCEKYDSGIFAESFVKWMREKLKEARSP